MPVKTILEDFSIPALIDAIEMNAIESCKAWSRWPGMELYEDADMIWTRTDIPFAVFNNVFRARLSPNGIEAAIETAVARFAERNVPMLWWIGPSPEPENLATHLEARGFVHGFEAAGMAVDLVRLADGLSAPRHLEIEEVRDLETLGTWCAVMAPVYEFPGFALEPWLDMHAAVGLGADRPYRHYIARLKGTPVATASAFFGAGVAGISNVATLPEFRGQGIATAVTLAPLLEARRMGYRVGVLFASTAAIGLYRRLGFREYCKGNCYAWTNE
ncbi:MAG: GNAT family N-acetyltransferase [Proteobacteria bacterium]|nr:GNAT family N-acetyltransferase [Pseudomonadota bacterium]